MPPLQTRGDALPLFRGVHSARWNHYLIRGDYVPLKVKQAIPSSMVSRDPTTPASVKVVTTFRPRS